MRALLLLWLAAVLVCGLALAAPPSPFNVGGFVFHNNSGGVENGIPVRINDTTLNTSTGTQVDAPPIPQLAGAYSATISSGAGNNLIVYAWNVTHYGRTDATVVSTTEVNVTLNLTRAPEPNITIVLPEENSTFEATHDLNVTVNVTLVGGGGNCSVSISFGNTSVVGLSPGEVVTHDLGFLSRNQTVNTTFSVRAQNVGVSSVSANASCTPGGPSFSDARTTDTVQNVTVVDTTPPVVLLVTPVDFQEVGRGLVNFSYTPTDVNLDNCTLYFGLPPSFGENATDASPASGANNSFTDLFFDIGVWVWNVFCTDLYGNAAFAPANFTLNVTAPDLKVNTSDIWFGNEQRIEGNAISVFANVTNIGLTAATTPFVVQFFHGDPSMSRQIGTNKTVNGLAVNGTVTLNETFVIDVGPNEIFVVVDPENVLNETRESNNNASRNISTGLYQVFYGNITTSVLLGTVTNESFFTFNNQTTFEGKVFVADTDSVFSFSSFVALTRNVTGGLPGDDFTDADANLNVTGFNDSLKQVWGGGTDSPLQTTTLNLSGGAVLHVPYVNSTNTWIVWDGSDDGGNGQYDTTDGEDLIFFTFINQSKTGLYGVYDYEIRIPSTLRDSVGTTSTVTFYYEIT